MKHGHGVSHLHPRRSAGSSATTDPTLSAPVLALATAGNVYPPTLNVTIDDTAQADTHGFELWYSGTVDFASHTAVAHTPITNAEALANAFTMSGLSGITSPAQTYFKGRITSGGLPSAWSNIILHGDIVAPAVTSSAAPSSNELIAMSYAVTADKAIEHIEVLGTDNALLEVSGTTIRLLSNALLDFEAKTPYIFTARAYAYNGLYGDLAVTFTVNNVVEIPSGLSNYFTDKTNASDSTLYTAAETYTVAGLAASLSVPITITGGEYRKNGGSWTSTAGTVTNGDTVEVRGTSGVGSATVVNVVLTIGGGSDTYSITNINTFDPASLFGGADEGYFFDISDLATVFSDAARTTLASVDGPVKGVTDKSGKGHHMAWVSGNTLTLRQSGAFYYLEASATNGITSNTVSLTQPWYRISALRISNWAQFQRVLGSGTASHGQIRQNGSTPAMYLNDSADGPTVNPTLGTDYTVSEIHNNTGSSIQLDNATAMTGTSGTQTGDGQILFNSPGGTNACAGRFYGDFAINRDPTSGEKANLKTFISARYGGAL